MNSVTPKDLRRSMVISRRVRPLSSTRALGMLSVRGRRRVPKPAAKIIAFMREYLGPSQMALEVNPRRGSSLSFAHFLEFDVTKVDVEAAPRAQSLCQLLSEIDGAVLAASATERNHQTFEAARLIVGDAGINE